MTRESRRDAAAQDVAIAAPLRAEWLALRPAHTTLVHTGMGPRRSIRSALRLDSRARIVAGVGGGLPEGIEPGDIVVATEVRGPEGLSVRCPSAPLIAGALRRYGLRVHCGPIVSVKRVIDGAGRSALARSGALAVDTESAWLVPPAGTPFAVVRAISDTERAPLFSPGIVATGFAALRALRRAVPVLDQWAAAVGPRRLLLASPRSIAGGRVVDLLDRARAEELHPVSPESLLVLVLGSAASAAASTLLDHARREGVAAQLIDDIGTLELGDLADATDVAIAAAEAGPAGLVDDLITAITGLGTVRVRRLDAA
jgi:hypothetical protein